METSEHRIHDTIKIMNSLFINKNGHKFLTVKFNKILLHHSYWSEIVQK